MPDPRVTATSVCCTHPNTPEYDHDPLPRSPCRWLQKMSGVFCVSCQGRHRRLQTGREIGVNSNVVEAETAQEIIATSRAAHIHSCTARYFSSHCNGGRLKRDEDRDRLTRNTSRSYFALKASVSSGNGAHDECNIFRQLNERRRSDGECSVASPNAVRRQKCGVSYGGSACHARLPAVPAESECGESPANEIRHFYRGLVARVLISWQSESGYPCARSEFNRRT